MRKTTDPSGSSIVFGHDFTSNEINSMSATSKNERNAVTYHYTTDFLTKLESSNTKFEYTYDGKGRKSVIYVNGESKLYVRFDYTFKRYNAHNQMGEVECNVVKSIFASDEVYTSYIDKFGRLLAVHYSSKEEAKRVIITSFYDEDKVVRSLDYKTNETILFEYDINGNVVKEVKKIYLLINYMKFQNNTFQYLKTLILMD